MKADVYQIVTDRIINLLEQGEIPWKKEWTGGEAPMNLVSKKPYRGVNTLLLGSLGYASPYFLTFKQAKQLGGSVKKGEKGCPVVFWKAFTRATDEAEGDEERMVSGLICRYYTVFNVEQTEGIDPKKIPTIEAEHDHEPIEAAQAIIDNMPKRPELVFGGGRAFYAPSQDRVTVPELGAFDTPEAFYCTTFHELVHSTGHPSRLSRKTVTAKAAFGSAVYSKEELVAELGASYLSNVAGFVDQTIENSAAYIQGWLKALRNDKKLLIHAAANAQKAADFILNIQPDYQAE